METGGISEPERKYISLNLIKSQKILQIFAGLVPIYDLNRSDLSSFFGLQSKTETEYEGSATWLCSIKRLEKNWSVFVRLTSSSRARQFDEFATEKP